MFALICAALIAVYILKRVYVVLNAQTNHDKRLPRVVTTVQPISIIRSILPESRLYRRVSFVWDERHTIYNDAELKTIVVMPLFHGRDMLYTSSLSAFRQCLALNAPIEKPGTNALGLMGPNVITTKGEAWKRHRRITAPAFNNSSYRNVWDTTARVYEEMVNQEGWLHVDETTAAEFNQITHKLALFLIAIVGFNISMSWSTPPRDEKGRLSIQTMFFKVASAIAERNQLPKWSYFLGFRKLNIIDEAYTTFEHFMHERIAEREAQLKKLRTMKGVNESDIAESVKDIFGRLVNSRLSDGKLILSEDEIIGNCFGFIIAGHQTTANALAAALALLALNPDKQEWVYNSIKSTVSDRLPAFDDFDALKGVLACFYEALRMYPPAYMMPKVAVRDLTLSIPRRDNPDIVEHLFVKKGTPITLDLVGILYDSQTFPDPEVFKPERWVSSGNIGSPRSSINEDTEASEVSAFSSASSLDGFVGFSFGPRTCPGHKFAKVEGVAFLTLLLREWRVEPALKDGESKEDWKERVLKPTFRMTLAVENVPLKLFRRK